MNQPQKTALVLFEYSGVFTNLLREKGYHVVQVDLELGIDIFNFNYKQYSNVQMVLGFPPCTHFAGSGARWWKMKDQTMPQEVQRAVDMVERVLTIVDYHKPKTWFIENPVGRIIAKVPKLATVPKWIFDAYQFAGYSPTPEKEAYTKKTCLYGNFKIPNQNAVVPILGTDKILNPRNDGKKLEWGSVEAKKIRNLTPYGFAKAFVEANN